MSPGSNGRAVIAFELADREWAEHTDATKTPGGGLRAEARRAARVQPDVTSPVTPAGSADAPEPSGTFSLTSELAREKHWKANQAELEFKKKASVYKDAEAIRAWVHDEFTHCKTKLLAVPSKLKIACPELTHAQLRIVDGLLREVLEDLRSEADRVAPAKTEESAA